MQKRLFLFKRSKVRNADEGNSFTQAIQEFSRAILISKPKDVFFFACKVCKLPTESCEHTHVYISFEKDYLNE